MGPASPNCVTFVMTHKAAPRRWRFFVNKTHRWAFTATAAAFAAGVAAGIAYKLLHVLSSAWPALWLLVCTQVLGIVSLIAAALPDWREFKSLEHTVACTVEDPFDSDLETIRGLVRYPRHELDHAKTQFENGARGLRERSGLLLGALDKVGLLPMIVSTCLTIAQAVRDGADFGPLAWASFSLVGVQLMAMQVLRVAQWMEKVASLYGRAIDLQATPVRDHGSSGCASLA